jgi:hypothetical protein
MPHYNLLPSLRSQTVVMLYPFTLSAEFFLSSNGFQTVGDAAVGLACSYIELEVSRMQTRRDASPYPLSFPSSLPTYFYSH